jgi:predicted DNA-binding transcriptional regulator AlpA
MSLEPHRILQAEDAPAAGSATTRSVRPEAIPEPLLINGRRFAALLGISRATFDRMKAAGRLPRHVPLSRGCHRWQLSEVREWISAGCPGQAAWEARRAARLRG